MEVTILKNAMADDKDFSRNDEPVLESPTKIIKSPTRLIKSPTKLANSKKQVKSPNQDNEEKSKNSRILPQGLPNFTNTCYLNAVVQLLSNMDNFKQAITMENLLKVAELYGIVKIRQVKSYGAKASFPCFYYIFELVKYLRENTNERLELDLKTEKKLQTNINGLREKTDKQEYCNEDQHDSQEFLTKLLDVLHEELNTVKMQKNLHWYSEEDINKEDLVEFYNNWSEHYIKADHSKVSENFTGDMLTELECSECGYRKYSFNKFGEIFLEAGVNVKDGAELDDYKNNFYNNHNQNSSSKTGKNFYDLLNVTFQAEEIDGLNCKKCKKPTLYYKQNMIWSFPKTLFIYVKRFVYYPIPRKIKERIFLEEEVMSLKEYSQDVIENFEDQKNGQYKIVGYIDHYGELGHGHYTTYTTESEGKEWYYFDDMKVKKVSCTQNLELFKEGSSDVYIMALELVD